MDSSAPGDVSAWPQATDMQSTTATCDSGTLDLQVRCPQCHHPVKVDTDSALHEITCASCGSTFSLVGNEQLKPDPSVPEFVGHFELLEKIGVGAFGSVWKAHDGRLDRSVAVKLPRLGQLDPLREEQFLREARAAAQLKHPHIVQIHEIGREGDTLFIVSDYVEGHDLAKWLDSHQPTFGEAARMCRDLALALDHAHRSGVIHRDVKPSNVLVDVHGQTHLMDFGLAKRDAGELTMTVDGHILGTPTHMSPEQARGEAHRTDLRTDVYSLGVILFQLLTGSRPFEGNAKMLLYHVLHTDPPHPRRLNPKIPRDLETICLKCMEKSPTARFATARLVADELDRFLDGRPVQTRPVGVTERARRWCRRNPALAAVSGLAAGLLIAGSLSVGWQWRRAERSLIEVREQKERATRHLLAAQDAVDELLTDIAAEMHDLPQTEVIRKRILARAADINQRFLQDEAIDAREAGIDTIKAWRRAADIAWQLKDTATTESALQSLIALCESTPRQRDSEAITAEHVGALCKLSGIAAIKKEWQESSQVLHDGLAILDKAPKATSSTLAQLRAELLRSLGINSERQGELDRAGDYYRQAVEIVAAIEPTSNEETRLLVSRAKTHSSFAIHCKQTEQIDDAFDHFAQTQHALTTLRQRFPDSAEYQSMLAQNQYNLANLELVSDQGDQARSRYLDAKNHFKQLAESFPRVVKYKDMWCNCLQGAALASKRPDQLRNRILILKKAAYLREEILRENPELVTNAIRLAQTYRNLGKDHVLAEQYDRARRCFRRAIGCGPGANSSAAAQERDQLDDAWCCSLLAQLELDLGHWDQARHWFEQAVTTRQPMTLDPDQQEDQLRDQAGIGKAIAGSGDVVEGIELIKQLPSSSSAAPAADLIAAKAILDVAKWLNDQSSESEAAAPSPRELQLAALDRIRSVQQRGDAKAAELALNEFKNTFGDTPDFHELRP